MASPMPAEVRGPFQEDRIDVQVMHVYGSRCAERTMIQSKCIAMSQSEMRDEAKEGKDSISIRLTSILRVTSEGDVQRRGTISLIPKTIGPLS
jgi:hypothetical protein